MSIPLRQTLTALRGIVYSSGFVVLWWWLAVTVRRYDAGLPLGIAPALRPFGLVVAAAGAVLTASCILVFIGFGEGTPAPFDAPRRFVAVGPYRWVRNPMYLGAIAVLGGAGLAIGSVSVLFLALAFWLLTHGLVVFYEEPVLEARFGESYARYKSTVNRWWPSGPAGQDA
jgi:protein-S-isoprenylcysteine O-methyltransferase Ste14